jgi:hypothetical protein
VGGFGRDRIERLTNRGNRKTWGVSITYTPHDGAPTSLTPDGCPLEAVFDSAHEMLTEDKGLEVSTRAPVLDIELSALAELPREGDKFTINDGPAQHVGETYTVVDPQFDSAQACKLICVKGDHSA